MVGDTSFPLGVTSDLRTTQVRPRRLFDSAHGKISVNVQTFAFVRLPSFVVKVLTPNRREPDQGAERVRGKISHTKAFPTLVEEVCSLGEGPVLIGKCGVLMDMHGREALKNHG
jgi:hypothetical protein